MELEVNSEAVAVETVEVVAGGEDAGAAALMGQQLMVANTQDLIVPSPEVGVSGSCSINIVNGLMVTSSPACESGGVWSIPKSSSPAFLPVWYCHSTCGGSFLPLSECADWQ